MTIDLQEVSRTLFATADQLWTNTALRPDQYAQPVLALIALRQMEAKFEKVHADLTPKFKGRLKPTPEDYRASGAVYLPETARFSRLAQFAQPHSPSRIRPDPPTAFPRAMNSGKTNGVC